MFSRGFPMFSQGFPVISIHERGRSVRSTRAIRALQAIALRYLEVRRKHHRGERPPSYRVPPDTARKHGETCSNVNNRRIGHGGYDMDHQWLVMDMYIYI